MHIKSFQVDDPMLECLGYSSMQGLNEPSFKAQKTMLLQFMNGRHIGANENYNNLFNILLNKWMKSPWAVFL